MPAVNSCSHCDRGWGGLVVHVTAGAHNPETRDQAFLGPRGDVNQRSQAGACVSLVIRSVPDTVSSVLPCITQETPRPWVGGYHLRYSVRVSAGLIHQLVSLLSAKACPCLTSHYVKQLHPFAHKRGAIA